MLQARYITKYFQVPLNWNKSFQITTYEEHEALLHFNNHSSFAYYDQFKFELMDFENGLAVYFQTSDYNSIILNPIFNESVNK